MNIRILRFLHRWYAAWNGYFWLPCPLCHEYFGGHEWSNDNCPSIPDSERLGIGKGICKNCASHIFYACGICDQYHRVTWDGDCRDDANRFTPFDLTDEELENALTMEEMVG